MQDFRTPIDRRRRPDGVVKFVTLTSALGWIMIALCFALIVYAKPEQTNMFYEMFNIPIREYWDYPLLNIVFILLIFLFAISMIGIIMNAMRQRRRSDRMKKSLIFQAIMSIIGIIILIFNSTII
jgi:heme/copper-type cytochrome/quinol oxidase subunit 2